MASTANADKQAAARAAATVGRRPEARWKQIGRRLLFLAIALQLVGVAVFVIAIIIGEATYPTFLALYAPRQPLLVVSVAALLVTPLMRRRVKVLLPVQIVVCSVVLFPVMGFNVGAPPRANDVVRLATYNVYFGKLGRPKLLDELAAMDVDILLIQAAYDSMPAKLRERFPDRHIHSFEDFIIVTRLPLSAVATPKPLDDGTSSMFVKYVIDTPRGRIGLYNVHPFSPRYALTGDDPMDRNIEHREAQIAAVIRAAQADGPPFLIVGDTNLPGLSSIKRRWLVGLQDAFEEVGFGFGYTFPAKRPWMRIDRALGSDDIHFIDSRVGPQGNSDHLPLFVEFELVER
jgi:endonuclease/exonuclease/phosphatase (EEP) superfamily protein YafD